MLAIVVLRPAQKNLCRIVIASSHQPRSTRSIINHINKINNREKNTVPSSVELNQVPFVHFRVEEGSSSDFVDLIIKIVVDFWAEKVNFKFI